ncbi:MAG: hypothetical protein IJ748_02115 [Bacteroidales bacterium]|nr:hypothetical protein [Bacteroidales bacterium]
MINKKIQLLKYLISDIVSAILAWVLFFVFRKVTIEYLLFKDPNQIFLDSNLIKGIIFIPIFWVTLYFFQGFYQKVYVRSRLKDFVQTLVISLIGVVILFFAFLLDDYVATYTNYYLYFAVLFVLHFTITYIPRYIITSITVKKVHRGKIEFPTILVVSDAEKALSLSQEIKNQVVSSGMSFAGYLSLKGERFDKLEAAKFLSLPQ